MKSYTVYNPRNGEILRSGSCQDHMLNKQNLQGESVLELASDPQTQEIDLQTLTIVPIKRETLQESYQLRRAREYPSTGEQLDVLWKEMRNLPRTEETEAMLQRILGVKARHPKP